MKKKELLKVEEDYFNEVLQTFNSLENNNGKITVWKIVMNLGLIVGTIREIIKRIKAILEILK